VKANIVKINQSEKETSEKRKKPRNNRLIRYRKTSGRWPVIDQTQEIYISATSSALAKTEMVRNTGYLQLALHGNKVHRSM
jgi:hypothetical protein